MKKIIKYIIFTAVFAFIAGLFYTKIYIPKRTFEIIEATRGDIKVMLRGIGNVSAQNIYSITAQTGGKILEIFADDGVWVKKGDLLVVMDGVDLPEQLEVANANLSKAQYDVISSKSELENQKVQKKLLQVTYSRYSKLKKQGFVAQSEYDQADTELKSIDTTIRATIARIDSMKAGVIVAKRTIDALLVKINRLKVYAPVDGFVIAKEAEVAQNVLPSTPILKIVDPKTLWIKTKIDERISSKIKINQKATITLRSESNKKYNGFVKRVEAMSDEITLEREIDVAFESIPQPFYINEQAEVVIDIKEYKNIVKIPLSVIVQNRGELGIWILKENHASFYKIEKIAQSDKEIAISNIDTDMQIIVPNKNKKSLSEDMKIYQ